MEKNTDKSRKLYEFTKPTVVSLVGKAELGKTNLLRHLIYKNTVDHKYFQFGIVFTGTKYDEEYDYLPDEAVIDGWDEECFADYVDYLKAQVKRLGKKKMPPNFMIFDDLIGTLYASKRFTNFMGTYRHTKTTIFITTQYLRKAIATELRENTKIAFIFRTRFALSLEGLYEAFGQLFKRKRDFFKLLENVTTENFNCLAYFDTADTIDTCYYKYKAPDMSEKKIQIDF